MISRRSPDSAERQGRRWSANRLIALISLVCILGYAAFVQWIWGWGSVFKTFAVIGLVPVTCALCLFCATYALRCYRIHAYFPQETKGRFWALFRVVQTHNLINIMMPFRAGETSFPLLMRSQFAIPLSRSTAALLVMRLLDLHALFAAAGIGLVLRSGYPALAATVWLLFLVSPVLCFAARRPILSLMRSRLPQRFRAMIDEIDKGVPGTLPALLTAFAVTCLNWGAKVIVFVWVLRLMGVDPIAACFGGALGGELSSVLPMHAPAGVGTYPAGIVAGALSFGASADAPAMAVLARASISAHMVIVVSAVLAAGLSLFCRASPKATSPS